MPHVGIAVFEAESYEKIIEVFTSPDYARVVVPDEEKFFDRTKTSTVAGGFATFIGQ